MDSAQNGLGCEAPAMSRVLERARNAQARWGSLAVEERIHFLELLSEGITARRDEIARRITASVGKPRYEALSSELLPALEALDFVLREAPAALASRAVEHRLLKNLSSEIHRDPYGVVALITPWNYPFFLTMAVAVPALAAGNAVVNKPSELTPDIGELVAELLKEAGLPEGLYQVVQGDGSVGAALIEAAPDFVSFTGSVATGRRIGAACGERLIPCQLELGGKDPALVLRDASLVRTARALCWGAFCNAGQVCASVERIIVVEEVFERFERLFVAEVKELRVGPDRAFGVDLGPLISEEHVERTHQLVSEAIELGARLLCGGQRLLEHGRCCYRPTILAEVDDRMRIAQEEIFGPVVVLERVPDEATAIRRANSSPFGLTASVWTESEGRGRAVAGTLDYASVYVNEVIMPGAAGETPWGGRRLSGIGSSQGREGLLALTRPKHVACDRLRLGDNPLWFPYDRRRYEIISDLLGRAFDRNPVARGAAFLKAFMALARPKFSPKRGTQE